MTWVAYQEVNVWDTINSSIHSSHTAAVALRSSLACGPVTSTSSPRQSTTTSKSTRTEGSSDTSLLVQTKGYNHSVPHRTVLHLILVPVRRELPVSHRMESSEFALRAASGAYTAAGGVVPEYRQELHSCPLMFGLIMAKSPTVGCWELTHLRAKKAAV